MQARLITSFSRLSGAEFLVAAGRIVAAMSGNPRFPAPWPAPAPSREELSAALAHYREALEASASRDRGRIAEREQAREDLTGMLQRLAAYLEFAAHGDEQALRSTGFELRRSTTRPARTETLEAPANVQLSHGARSGEIELHSGRLDGSSTYEIQIAQGDPGIEANWRHLTISRSLRRVTLSGLTPLQMVWIRVRGFGVPGAGRWSEPVSIVVL
jgi:hypothetical protein